MSGSPLPWRLKRHVSDEAEGLAAKLGLKFYRTSVKQGFNVNELFENLSEMAVKHRKAENEQAAAGESATIGACARRAPSQRLTHGRVRGQQQEGLRKECLKA